MNTKQLNIIVDGFIFAALFTLDRSTKYYALHHFANGFYVNNFLSFDLAFNRGISWSMFHSANDLVFIAVSSLIAIIIAGLVWHTVDSYRAGNVIIGELCVLAGATSNLVDRVVYRGVVDFIHLSYGNFSWPLFNIADVSIVVGVCVMVILNIRRS